MSTVIMAGAVVLVVLGFGNHVWWLAAAALLLGYARYARPAGHEQGTTSATMPGPGTPTGAAPATYRAYRARRDQQAKWERRYRRERPFEARRQDRGN
ncbi:hypothetical protein ACFV0T_32235 [Streptomyces sp. NPDC059582]|uniref:hypothetical protein n=1 Tax=Streptomyces sp. NPDC059582 TaxID=3346875 RepID=UPI0036C6BB16